MNRFLVPAVALASVAVTGAAQAAIVDPVAAGYVNAADVIASESSNWVAGNLTATANPNYPGFFSTAPWPAPITAASGDGQLNKVSNGTGGAPYPGGESIYFGGTSSDPNVNGGTLAVSDSTPLVDLSFVTFQVTIGEAFTFDFFDSILPTLSYNDGSQDLAAGYFEIIHQEHTGTITMPSGEEDLFRNTYYLTWDLSEIEAAIESLSISFTAVQHAQVYGLRLDQYVLAIEDNGGGVIVDPTDPPAVVPTPSALGLALVGGLLTLARRRRQA